MEVGDERADVASVHGLTVPILSAVIVHEILNGRLPLAVVGIIHRKVSPDIRSANVRMGEQKLTKRRIEGETMRALTSGVYQHRAGAVDDVSGGHLAAPGLEH